MLVVLPLLGCGERARVAQATQRELSFDCNMVWDPTWRQANSNEWWAEYFITGGRVESAWLEVGSQVVSLAGQWGDKWSATPPHIATGTPVVLHARNSLDQWATTYPFGYLGDQQPSTDPCAGSCVPRCGAAMCGDDGCGGSCGRCGPSERCDEGACVQAPRQICSGGTCTCAAPWDPFWQQVNANNWWIEYTISRGTVTAAWVEIVGGERVPLSLEAGRWVGSPPHGIAAGAKVVLHARDDAGRTAQTAPFEYLTTTQFTTDACLGSGPPSTCGELAAGMVSINFDDGFDAQYTLARDELNRRGMKATLYLISEAIAEHWPGYLTLPHAQALMNDGNEIGSHTVDHPNLAQMPGASVDDELRLSKEWLETTLGATVDDFASPYGAYNSDVLGSARRYYRTHTTVETGLNFRGDDLYRLKRVTVTRDLTPAQIRLLIQQAQSERGWLILLFHDFTGDPLNGFSVEPTSAPPPNPYSYPISDFRAVLDDLAASGLEVVDVSHGAARLNCQ